MRTDRTVPNRLPLLANGFRLVLVVYVSVSTALEPGTQPATHVGRASLLVPRSGQGVNPDARLLVRKTPPSVTADTKSEPGSGQGPGRPGVVQGQRAAASCRRRLEEAEAPRSDGVVGDSRSRRLRRKLRRSVVGGSQGAGRGPDSPRRTCAKQQLPEKSGGNARRVRRRQDLRLRGCPITRS